MSDPTIITTEPLRLVEVKKPFNKKRAAVIVATTVAAIAGAVALKKFNLTEDLTESDPWDVETPETESTI
jgi:hypothetical protein